MKKFPMKICGNDFSRIHDIRVIRGQKIMKFILLAGASRMVNSWFCAEVLEQLNQSTKSII